jgi:hypothetical protein
LPGVLFGAGSLFGAGLPTPPDAWTEGLLVFAQYQQQ